MNEFKPDVVKPLLGHTSAETAYLVDDYPYGFTLRCKIRYWLEYKPKNGFRFVSQTSNPKRGDTWNKPKASTYVDNAAFMYLDSKGHVQWHGLGMYSDATESQAFLNAYRDCINPDWLQFLERWVRIKNRYEEIKASNDGDYRKAAFQALLEERKANEKSL